MKRGPAAAFFLAVLLAASRLYGAPLEEIRDILRRHLLNPPGEAALAALSEENLPTKLRDIDPYARIFSAAEYRAFTAARHAWVGIGADLSLRGSVPILHIYRGGPADRAGIPDRSRLLEIDGRPASGLDAETLAILLKGQEGTDVHLMVGLPDGSKARFRLRRESFTPLDVEMVPAGDRHVVRIRDFVGGMTRPALRSILNVLFRMDPAHKAARLIVDLRDAPGGDLYEAFDLAGVFLPAGTLLGTIRGRDGNAVEIRAPQGDKYAMPLILLVGPETASAAEIFAGVLRHHGRALLVGRTTFGKCLSQTDLRLSDGSVLRYTNKEVLLPGGESCTGKGLTPDLAVREFELDSLPRLVKRAESLRP